MKIWDTNIENSFKKHLIPNLTIDHIHLLKKKVKNSSIANLAVANGHLEKTCEKLTIDGMACPRVTLWLALFKILNWAKQKLAHVAVHSFPL